MRILILGGSGMLGHQLMLSLKNEYELYVTFRKPKDYYSQHDFLITDNSIFELDVLDDSALQKVLNRVVPDAIINCVGIIKQSDAASSSIDCIETNALFPNKLALLCDSLNIRLIHISTDCVFSGDKGNYIEEDLSDAYDLYGKTKYLGEISGEHCLTLRTSIIGLELFEKRSLIEWFLQQKGTIYGYKNAIYSGFTTIEMARIINMILIRCPELHGLYHVSSKPISKYDLLTKLSSALDRSDILINENTSFHCDRSLSSEKFSEATGYHAPDWRSMLSELAQQIKNREQIV